MEVPKFQDIPSPNLYNMSISIYHKSGRSSTVKKELRTMKTTQPQFQQMCRCKEAPGGCRGPYGYVTQQQLSLQQQLLLQLQPQLLQPQPQPQLLPQLQPQPLPQPLPHPLPLPQPQQQNRMMMRTIHRQPLSFPLLKHIFSHLSLDLGPPGTASGPWI